MNAIKAPLSLFVFFLVLFSLACSLSAPAADPVKITISGGEIIAAGRQVTLGDVAKLTGGTPGIRNTMEKIFITQTPGSGQFVRVTETYLKSRIARANISGSDYILEMPHSLKIYSNSSVIRTADFSRAATDYLKKQDRWTPGLKLSINSYQPSRTIPAGTLTYSCKLVDEGEDAKTVKVRVDAQVNGKTVDSRDIVFIPPGKGVAKSAARDTTSSHPQIKGSGDIKIRRGDPLKIQFIRKNMNIVVEGTAAGLGSPGDTIRVTTKAGKKTFNAKLLDASTAVVEL